MEEESVLSNGLVLWSWSEKSFVNERNIMYMAIVLIHELLYFIIFNLTLLSELQELYQNHLIKGGQSILRVHT